MIAAGDLLTFTKINKMYRVGTDGNTLSLLKTELGLSSLKLTEVYDCDIITRRGELLKLEDLRRWAITYDLISLFSKHKVKEITVSNEFEGSYDHNIDIEYEGGVINYLNSIDIRELNLSQETR